MDKLADGKDIEAYEKHQREILKKIFDDVPESEVLSKPLIYCHFAKWVKLRPCLKNELIEAFSSMS